MLKVAALVSGGGTTLAAIGQAIKHKKLAGVELSLVIASKHDIKAIERARLVGVSPANIVYLSPKGKTPDEFGSEIIEACEARGVNFVGQYGWLPLTPKIVVEHFKDRIVNQHPGPLDPKAEDCDFGGKGMYGIRVSAARLYFVQATQREFRTYATVHRVTPKFDRGEVLCEKPVPIFSGDTPELLQQRLFPSEYEATIEVLDDFAKGRVRVVGHPKYWLVRSHSEQELLRECKQLAIIQYP